MKVVCVYDFSKEREIYGFNYPQKGEILTVIYLEKHLDFYLLYFWELPFGLCSNCFRPFQEEKGEMFIEEFITEPMLGHKIDFLTNLGEIQ